jgi:hypothetical protein
MCPVHRPKAQVDGLDTNLRVAFEHDFVRLEQQTRAAHAFFNAGLFEPAVEWLTEIMNVARGLRAAMSPCEHEWYTNDDGELRCRKGCTAVQLR